MLFAPEFKPFGVESGDLASAGVVDNNAAAKAKAAFIILMFAPPVPQATTFYQQHLPSWPVGLVTVINLGGLHISWHINHDVYDFWTGPMGLGLVTGSIRSGVSAKLSGGDDAHDDAGQSIKIRLCRRRIYLCGYDCCQRGQRSSSRRSSP
jgi:hypothetical protein